MDLNQALAEQGLTPAAQTPPAQVPVQTTIPATPAAEPATQTPAQEPAEPVVTQTEPPKFDETTFLSGMLGGKFKTFKDWETSYNELEKSNKQLEEISKKDPFANPLIKGLNEYVQGDGDPEVYLKLQKLNLDKLSPAELMVNEFMVKRGMDKAEAEELVGIKYKIGQSEKDEDGQVIKEVREAQLLLKADSHDAREFLKGYKSDNLVAPAQKALEQSIKTWEEVLPKISSEVKMSAKIGEMNFDLPVDPSAVKSASETVMDMVRSGMLPIDPSTSEGRAAALDMITQIVKADSFEANLNFLMDQERKRLAAEQHHVRPPADQAPPVVQVDRDHQIMNALLKAG